MDSGPNQSTAALEKRRWGSTPMGGSGSDKQGVDQPSSYTPFKSINGGRSGAYTDDLYQPSLSMRCDAEVAMANGGGRNGGAQGIAQAAGRNGNVGGVGPNRPPSRAYSIYGNSSVLYQPLTSSNQQVNSAWGNSMINKHPSDLGFNSSSGPPPPTPSRYGVQSDPDPGGNGGGRRVMTANGAGKMDKNLGSSQTPSSGYCGSRSNSPPYNDKRGRNSFLSLGRRKKAEENDVVGLDDNASPLNLRKILRTPVDIRRMSQHEKKMQIFERLGWVRLLLGLCIFSLGVSRLALGSVWSFGMDLVYGLYATLSACCGIYGHKKKNVCSLVGFFIMSAISCVICIFPIVTAFMVTIPFGTTKFSKLGAEYFTSATEPYTLDLTSGALCVLDGLASIFCCVWGCWMTNEILRRFYPSSDDVVRHIFDATPRPSPNESAQKDHDRKNGGLHAKFDEIPQFI